MYYGEGIRTVNSFLRLIILFFLVVLLIVMVIPGNVVYAQEEFYRGRVLSVKDFESKSDFITLEQEAKVLISNGPYKGQEIIIENSYIKEDLYMNIYLAKDMGVILATSFDNGQPKEPKYIKLLI